MTRNLRLAAVLFLGVLGAAATSAAQDTIASARQLYGSAAYDEALAMLDRLKTGSPAGSDGLAVNQYRAFCLMALGRQGDALQAVEAVVSADPLYVPNEAEIAPRVVAAFKEARRRLLPTIAQQQYQAAKALYDRKDYPGAVQGFDATLRILAAPDLAEAGAQPPLSDLRTLISGFRDLAIAASAPPPKPVEAPKPAPPPPPPPKAFYTAGDANVVPPSIVSQRIPAWPGNLLPGFARVGRTGVIEVVINEEGAVETAVMRQPVAALYDELLVKEARNWRYKPATKDNLPVKFKKMVQVNVQ